MARSLYYRVLNYRPVALELLHRHFEVVTLDNPNDDCDEVLAGIQVCFAPLGFYLGPEKMDRMPHLRVIGSSTTSLPHVDEDYAERHGIRIVSLRDATDFLARVTPTAELTWGLMIALMRNVVPGAHSVLAGQWSRWPFAAPRMMSRMSLGIVGLGRIGSMVARYGSAFGMDVLYFDPFVTESDVAQRAPTLESLVEASDVVTLHCHLTPQTVSLIDRAVFQRFRDGAYLVNTARGAIVEPRALIRALETGKLAGAAIDVLDDEHEREQGLCLDEHPLIRYARTHHNLLITPHIGGSTVDAWEETQLLTIKRVIDTLKEGSGERVV